MQRKNRTWILLIPAAAALVSALALLAGCNKDESTQTDKEAVQNASKASKTTAPPAGAPRRGAVAPPPP